VTRVCQAIWLTGSDRAIDDFSYLYSAKNASLESDLVSRVAKLLLVPVLLVCAAAMLSACGEEDRSHLLPGNSVQEIEANIDTVQTQVDQGLCLEALESADQVQKQVESLPRSVDPELRRTLLDGAVTLIQVVRDSCVDSGETDVTEPEVEVTPTGDTGVTDAEEGTGTSGKPAKPDKPAKPVKPTPEPTPEPDPPTTPETPPSTDPPVDTGPGSGGITPNQ